MWDALLKRSLQCRTKEDVSSSLAGIKGCSEPSTTAIIFLLLSCTRLMAIFGQLMSVWASLLLLLCSLNFRGLLSWISGCGIREIFFRISYMDLFKTKISLKSYSRALFFISVTFWNLIILAVLLSFLVLFWILQFCLKQRLMQWYGGCLSACDAIKDWWVISSDFLLLECK